MDKPFPAYKGTEPFVFVCYAHSDSSAVYSDLVLLNQEGINVWYDEGISAGKSWREEIATAIKGASKLIFYISDASLKSAHCLREVDYALNHEIEIIPVYLDECRLPGELELVFSRIQALFRKTDSMYMEHLLAALRATEKSPPVIALTRKRRPGLWLPLLTLGISLLAAVVWVQRDSNPLPRQLAQSSSIEPNAYDHYLDGLDFLERWDKDENLDTAISLFREATTLDPGFALAYARLAEGLRLRYGLTGDEAWLEQAAESADTALRLNADLAPVQVAFGRIQTSKGNLDLAYAALERALEIDSNDAMANQSMANVYARLGRLQDAEVSYQKAVALDPESPTILNAYANFLYDQSRFNDAIDQWQAVIRLAPDNYAALVNMGSALNEIRRIPEAITMYQRAIDIRPSYMAYLNLGTAYSRGERYQDAVNAYLKALEIDDSDWLAWGNLAYVYSWINGMDPQATETFEHAIELAEAARQQNTRDPFVHSDLALYYAKMGRSDIALQRLETAIILAPDSGEVLAAVAEAYETMGLRDKAVEFARKSLENGFSSQQLQVNPELSELVADPRMLTAP